VRREKFQNRISGYDAGAIFGKNQMLDPETLEFAIGRVRWRAEAERIMRDDARRVGRSDIAMMHGDRAAVLDEAVGDLRAELAKLGGTE
jgi:hypothetical protein